MASILLVAEMHDCAAFLTECEKFLHKNLPEDNAGFKTWIEYVDRYCFPTLLTRIVNVVPGGIFASLLDFDWIETLQKSTFTVLIEKNRACFGRWADSFN